MAGTRLETLVERRNLKLKWEPTETTSWEDGPRVLVINPGSRSIKLGLQDQHGFSVCDVRDIPKGFTVSDYAQLALAFLSHYGFLGDKDVIKDLDSISFRSGAGLRPVRQLGVYALDAQMIADLKAPTFPHDSNFGGRIAYVLSGMGTGGRQKRIPCYTRDLITTDQLDILERFSGLPQVQVECRAHFLNMTAALRDVYCKHFASTKFEDLSAIIVHLGGGIGIAGFEDGRYKAFVDAAGEMPSETRAGGLHLNPHRVAKYAVGHVLSSDLSYESAMDWVDGLFMKMGGLVAYLKTADVGKIAEISEDPEKAAKHHRENKAFFTELFERCGGLPKGLSREEAVQNLANNALDALVYNVEAGIGRIYGSMFSFRMPETVVVTGGLLYQPAIKTRLFRRMGLLDNIRTETVVKEIPGQQEMRSLLCASLPDLEESCGGPGRILSYKDERYDPRNSIFLRQPKE